MDERPTEYKCPQCASGMAFDPVSQSLKCPSCGYTAGITGTEGPVQEQDYAGQLDQLLEAEPTHERLTHRCGGCGVEIVLPADTTAGRCPFCGGAVIVTGASRKTIRPRSLLPFAVSQAVAVTAYQTWVSGLWFAPTELKRRAERAAIHGAYLPAWTYDALTDSQYTGERGDDYWDTETYTTTENGQTVTKTREVRKTRWSSARGAVREPFDDVLIMASVSLPPKLLGKLAPWDLLNLVPFADGYLTGFVAESYQVGLTDGFEQAKGVMAVTIRQSIERDIGGDHQRIDSVNTWYSQVRFKHLLLPVWVSAYRFNGVAYRFVVNGRTGRVRGERPYSAWKITLLVLLIAVAIAIGVMVASAHGR